MSRQYGNKRRTNADKKAAALQFVVLGSRSDEEKERALVASYGFTPAEAAKFVREYGG